MFSVITILIALFCLPATSSSEITKIVIDKREPFANGHEFGVTGAYEKLIGKAYGEVNPDTKHNKGIVNLKRAPRNERGRAEYSMDVFMLKPMDMKRGNQTIFYDVVNRGNQALRVNYGAERSNNPIDARPCRRRLHDAARLHAGLERLAGRCSTWRRQINDKLSSRQKSGGKPDPSRDHNRVCFR